MADSNVSRRGLLQILSVTPAVTAFGAEAHMHPAAAPEKTATGPYERQTFDDHQWQAVRVLCDFIIPKDDRSGSAVDAGVPEFLDDWIAYRTEQDGNENLKAQIFGGLMWLDHESNRLWQKNFVDAAQDQQKQLLDRIAYPKRAAKEDQPWVHFFTQFRALTVGGFFSSKMGVADLPYLGNKAIMHWNGCDPKVWAEIENRLKNGYKGVLEAKPWSAVSQS